MLSGLGIGLNAAGSLSSRELKGCCELVSGLPADQQANIVLHCVYCPVTAAAKSSAIGFEDGQVKVDEPRRRS